MSFDITRPGKYTLTVSTPVMPASGTFGFGDVYRDMVNFDKLGAIVTNPVTYAPWSPASGTRVVPVDAGVLMHTGLPNPGLSKILRQYEGQWGSLPVPLIVHLVGTTDEEVRKSASRLDEVESVAAIELGLSDDIAPDDAEALVKAAVQRTDKPVLVRLPFHDAPFIAGIVADAGAGALVVAAPPRGTARDPLTGRLVSGRIYGPVIKPMALRMVGQIARQLPDIPVIGAGGIHSTFDARDFIEAGAKAVQVDSVTWIRPNLLERVARDLGGWIVTRAAGAFPDEWHPDMGDTEHAERQRKDKPARKKP